MITSGKNLHAWKNGYWLNLSLQCLFTKINGESLEIHYFTTLDYPDEKPKMLGTITHGDFGIALPRISTITGIDNFNVNMALGPNYQLFGVISQCGSQIHFVGLTNDVEEMKWVSDEEFRNMAKNREPVETPSCLYLEAQRDKPKKLVWISGT